MKKIQVANLIPGQEVALANCRDIERVISREGKNLYRVTFKGGYIVIGRSALAVRVHGRWLSGPHNTTDAI
jgi:hypothetical protein